MNSYAKSTLPVLTDTWKVIVSRCACGCGPQLVCCVWVRMQVGHGHPAEFPVWAWKPHQPWPIFTKLWPDTVELSMVWRWELVGSSGGWRGLRVCCEHRLDNPKHLRPSLDDRPPYMLGWTSPVGYFTVILVPEFCVQITFWMGFI